MSKPTSFHSSDPLISSIMSAFQRNQDTLVTPNPLGRDTLPELESDNKPLLGQQEYPSRHFATLLADVSHSTSSSVETLTADAALYAQLKDQSHGDEASQLNTSLLPEFSSEKSVHNPWLKNSSLSSSQSTIDDWMHFLPGVASAGELSLETAANFALPPSTSSFASTSSISTLDFNESVADSYCGWDLSGFSGHYPVTVDSPSLLHLSTPQEVFSTEGGYSKAPNAATVSGTDSAYPIFYTDAKIDPLLFPDFTILVPPETKSSQHEVHRVPDDAPPRRSNTVRRKDRLHPYTKPSRQGGFDVAPAKPRPHSHKRPQAPKWSDNKCNKDTINQFFADLQWKCSVEEIHQLIVAAHIGTDLNKLVSLRYYDLELSLWPWILTRSLRGIPTRMHDVDLKITAIRKRLNSSGGKFSHSWTTRFLERYGLNKLGWLEVDAESNRVLPAWVNFLRQNFPHALNKELRASWEAPLSLQPYLDSWMAACPDT